MKNIRHFVCGTVLALAALAPTCAQAAEQVILRNGFSLVFDSRETIGANTRLYLTSAKDSYVDILTSDVVEYTAAPPPALVPAAKVVAAAPIDVPTIVTAAARQHQLDPDLINSVIRAESSFNTKAVSPKGARGLMQLMPGTAQQLGVGDSFDASANVNGGTKHLYELLVKNNFDLAKALAAYNAGQHRVQQYRGVPPYRETRTYVAKIIRDFNRKKLAQQAATKPPKPVLTGRGGMR